MGKDKYYFYTIIFHIKTCKKKKLQKGDNFYISIEHLRSSFTDLHNTLTSINILRFK